MTAWLKALLSVFYPEVCLQCGNVLDDSEQTVCGNCIAGLPRTFMAVNKDNLAEMKFATDLKILRAASYCRYSQDSDFRNMIHRAKYGNHPEIMYRLAQQAATEWRDTGFFDGVDVIVPVPLHKKKLRERGYNQSDFIAHGLGDELGVAVCEDALARIRNDQSQTMQDMTARSANVKGAFAVNEESNIKGKTVLLVDDVLTTGATLSECVTQLRKIPKTKIVVFTLAIAAN